MFTHYSSWEDYLKNTKEPDEDKWEKSFLVYAKSYWLEGHSILKAVLQDDNGEERESQLDLNHYIGADTDGNQNAYLTVTRKHFLDSCSWINNSPPQIHEDREWGPMFCVGFYYHEGRGSRGYGNFYQRVNLGEYITVKNGELAFSFGPLSGVPRPPREEPWRMYFKDLEVLNYIFEEEDNWMCFLKWGQGWGRNSNPQCEAARYKYFYLDRHEGEIDEMRHGARTPFLLWLRSEFLAGRLSVRKKLEEKYGKLKKKNMAMWLRSPGDEEDEEDDEGSE